MFPTSPTPLSSFATTALLLLLLTLMFTCLDTTGDQLTMDKDNISVASSIRSFLDPLWSTPRAPVPNNVEFLGNIDEMDFVPLSWDVPVRETPVNARQNCSTSRRSLLGAIFLATVVLSQSEFPGCGRIRELL